MFVQAFPAWCNASGVPLSWRHYVIGTRALGRLRARDRLDMMRAVSAAHAKEDEYAAWQEQTAREAGW